MNTRSETPKNPQRISVILTTYNSPTWLEKVLCGYDCQSYRSIEIVVADDGSGPETAAVVDQFQSATDLDVQHVWQEDEGFQKCKILNKAIQAATGDYLLFSDGDCVPRGDFVQIHAENALTGRFLSGGYYKLPMSISQQMTSNDIRDGRAFKLGWLRQQGLPLSHRYLRLQQNRRFAKTMNVLTPTQPTWNGNNSSGWKSDIVAANGFDERMRYGGLDRELGQRLENAGIRGKHVRYEAVCLHLDHPRGYENRQDWQRNYEIRRQSRELGLTETEYGIRKAA